LTWQRYVHTSQIHLCADVANFQPTPADLGRLLTRSLKRAVYIPSLIDEMAAEMSGSGVADEFTALVFDDPWLVGSTPPDREGVPLAVYEGVALDDEMARTLDEVDDEAHDGEGRSGESELLQMAEEGAGVTVYLWAAGFWLRLLPGRGSLRRVV
jgi:hypothetical protein